MFCNDLPSQPFPGYQFEFHILSPYLSGNDPFLVQQFRYLQFSNICLQGRFAAIDGQRARWAEATERCVQETTKPCPKCNALIEKNSKYICDQI